MDPVRKLQVAAFIWAETLHRGKIPLLCIILVWIWAHPLWRKQVTPRFSPHGRLWNGRSGWPPLASPGYFIRKWLLLWPNGAVFCGAQVKPGWGAWSHWPPLLLYFFKPIVLKYSTFQRNEKEWKARKWDRAGVRWGCLWSLCAC